MDEIEFKELCKRKNFFESRNPNRISAICDEIESLWNEKRKCNKNTGFYFVINLIILEGRDTNSGDIFYWEEDKWYDLIKNMTKNVEPTMKKFQITTREKELAHNVMFKFEEFWRKNSDLRFFQIVLLLDDMLQEYIRLFFPFDVEFWDKFFNFEMGEK